MEPNQVQAAREAREAREHEATERKRVIASMFYLVPAGIICAECGHGTMAGAPADGSIGRQMVFCPNKSCGMYGRAHLIELEPIAAVDTGIKLVQTPFGQWMPEGQEAASRKVNTAGPIPMSPLIALPGGKDGKH